MARNANRTVTTEDLIAYARVAADRAYCPYSKFRVGAAVECRVSGSGADPPVILGSNIENASYGLTVCAERVALFSAVSRGLVPVRLAVSCPELSPGAADRYRMPCGACRQVMSEFMPATTEVLIDSKPIQVLTLADLLPAPFSLKSDRGASE